MYFSSAKNAGLLSNAELIVFKHGEEQILVTAPDTYEGAMTIVKDEFGIENDSQIILETADVADCGPVNIRPTAWAAVLPLLSRVDVKVVERKVNDNRALVGPNAAGPSNAATVSHKGKSTISSQEDLPIQLSAIRQRPPFGRISASHARTPNKPQSSAKIAKPKVAEVTPQDQKLNGARSSAQPESSTNRKAQKQPVRPVIQEKAYEETDELMEEDVEELPALRSPKKSKRPRVDSDFFEEEEVHILEEVSVKRRRQSVEETAVIPDILMVEAKPSNRRTETLKAVDRRSSPVPRSKESSLDTSKHVLSGGAASNGSSSKASSSTAVAFDPNASFVITVVLVDNEENSESSPFKTKNKHTVYKVLRTACATFELTEDEQDRASLCCYDESTEKYIPYPRDASIGQIGITADTPLYIVLEEVGEEEEEDS